ncbi:hypothetical protein [Gordonia sp. (in: high G+C Gram-positive bacteria)]|uniref:hypothetical protein n=1 Tax=Gordonia sp. (in: high G+C Gram-positive bacteria) TaxID=84139 RepID=UPI0039E5B21B
MRRITGALALAAAGATILVGAAVAPQAAADPAPAPANCKLYPECLWNEEGSTWPGVDPGTSGTSTATGNSESGDSGDQ